VSLSAPVTIRVSLLIAIALNLLMIAARVFQYRPFLAMPGSITFIVEPAVLLIVYGLLVLWVTSTGGPTRQTVLLWGTSFGLVAGALEVAHMILENFGGRIGENSTITLVFMFAAFLIWGLAGYRAARRTMSPWSGVLAGCWSAIVTMLLVVTFGFVLMCFTAPQIDYIATWAEFKRSGWPDVRAFAIANTLESGFSHLLTGPIVGAIFGGIATILSRINRPAA
jgi:hypothetical protein